MHLAAYIAGPVLRRVGPGAGAYKAMPRITGALHRIEVLEGCGLVRSGKTGRIRTYQISLSPLKAAEGWLSEQRVLWERRLDQLDRYLAELKRTATAKRKKDKTASCTPDADSCRKHDAMGFYEGWGTVLEQLILHVESLRP